MDAPTKNPADKSKNANPATNQAVNAAPGRGAPALNAEKAKALQAALAQIEKQFGEGSIMRLGAGTAR